MEQKLKQSEGAVPVEQTKKIRSQRSGIGLSEKPR